MKEQKGQIILILLLVVTVALGLGISVLQRSLVDVSTSSKIENSQRALSAAEAGLERILRGGSGTSIDFPENMASANINFGDLTPCMPGSLGCAQVSGRQLALEYPPLSKEEVAHVWFADYNSTAIPPTPVYQKDSVDIFWGQANSAEKTALEATAVYYGECSSPPDNRSEYCSRKYFFDPDPTRAAQTNFTPVSCSLSLIMTTLSPPSVITPDRTFSCKTTISSLPANLMLIRVRLLYNLSNQPLAVQAVGIAGSDCPPQAGCFLPPQAKIYTSTGTSGQTERKIQVFTLYKVVPFYFDYAIFSAGEINK